VERAVGGSNAAAPVPRTTHLFRGEVGVSEPNQDSQKRVVRPFVVFVHRANALQQVVPAPDCGLVGIHLWGLALGVIAGSGAGGNGR
jgi:hypothetical protein